MAAQLAVPAFGSLAEIYPAERVVSQGERWNNLTTAFKSRYGALPTHIVRAPGRVNILGEHVDYSLFPVLPAAIEQDILIAIRTVPGGKCRIANVLPSFKPSEFTIAFKDGKWDAGLVAPSQGGGWENYVKVALIECAENYFPGGKGEPAGIDMLVDGTVPPGAGLSSSAAFVVSSVIMFLVANGKTEGVTKGEVVRLAIASEHRMGLRTGGMDQSASALSVAGSILHLSFHPSLEAEPLPLPPNLAVVITNSMAPHALADSAPERYNLRVVEVLCASRLLLHAWDADQHTEDKVGCKGRVWLKEALDKWEGSHGRTDAEAFQAVLDDLPRVLGADGHDARGWTRDEMVAASGMTADDFAATYLDFIPVRASHFQLYKRAQHTFAESLRVAQFKSLCENKRSAPSTAAELGALLNGSHESLRDLFDATVPEVETLRDLCLKHGALGARQTGGGWGGAVISLLPTDKVAGFLEQVKKDYAPYASLGEDELDNAAFASLPGTGAGFYTVSDDGVKA